MKFDAIPIRLGLAAALLFGLASCATWRDELKIRLAKDTIVNPDRDELEEIEAREAGQFPGEGAAPEEKKTIPNIPGMVPGQPGQPGQAVPGQPGHTPNIGRQPTSPGLAEPQDGDVVPFDQIPIPPSPSGGGEYDPALIRELR